MKCNGLFTSCLLFSWIPQASGRENLCVGWRAAAAVVLLGPFQYVRATQCTANILAPFNNPRKAHCSRMMRPNWLNPTRPDLTAARVSVCCAVLCQIDWRYYVTTALVLSTRLTPVVQSIDLRTFFATPVGSWDEKFATTCTESYTTEAGDVGNSCTTTCSTRMK